ncbi:unnamed protein product [Zymoseptoria tritici ST99CH_1E4]|uniref:Hydrophobin n=1 Tax=Zymoseptoria tritici ST99CH_1E4 TaxID=1276532 RepID=A0A2H1G5N4_ZYMTR|nr:unnamed protein product [Zymoseptoria tritici ST99CH_1E4]
MYTSTTAVLAIALAASTTLAAPSQAKRQTAPCMLNTVNNPSTNQVASSINQWNADVDAVNTFLNTALTLPVSELGAAAQNAFNFAQDEPCQLMTLASVPAIGTAAFTCAVSDLTNIFKPRVLDNLQSIINKPTDTAAVHAAVNDINLIRCCNVLPDATILWTDTAEDSGIGGTVQTVANRENACATVDCSAQTPVCASMDNGSF